MVYPWMFGYGLGGLPISRSAYPPSSRNLARGSQLVQVQGQLLRAKKIQRNP